MTPPTWMDRLRPPPPAPAQGPESAPVIILGMHRSGTSMICEMLEQAGLFAGEEKDPNNESTYFLRLNDWVLSQAGARWDTPEHFADLLANDDLATKVADQLQRTMSAPSCVEYLGRTRYRTHGRISALTGRWGWKDPRNTLTLPLWLRVFPGARIIHVRRHGLDVAASLRQRSRTVLQQWRPPRKKIDGALVIDSARCFHLERAFTLWVEYMDAAARHLAASSNPVYALRYEDFLLQPAAKLAELAAFCGLDVTGERIRAIATGARSERAYSYRSSDELMRYAATVQPLLSAHGYA
jgi:hypothetical protein